MQKADLKTNITLQGLFMLFLIVIVFSSMPRVMFVLRYGAPYNVQKLGQAFLLPMLLRKASPCPSPSKAFDVGVSPGPHFFYLLDAVLNDAIEHMGRLVLQASAAGPCFGRPYAAGFCCRLMLQTSASAAAGFCYRPSPAMQHVCTHTY